MGGWMERDRQDEGGEIERAGEEGQTIQVYNKHGDGPVSPIREGRITKIWCDSQFDSPLTEYYLLLGCCWSITHFLYSLPPQQVPPGALWWSLCWSQSPALCGPPSCETGAACWEARRCGPERACDDWRMRPSSLYLCIQAALCCPHSQWQEVEPKGTATPHLRGPLPQLTAGAWTQSCTAEGLMLTD